METHAIKKMFEMTDRALPIQEERKQQTLEKMLNMLEKQNCPVEKMHHILLELFLYMDKTVVYAYGALICMEIISMIAFRHIEIDTKEVITFCIVGAGIISVAAIILLDQMFFGKMAELTACCYFSTKQSIAAFMIMEESINLVMLLIVMLYVGTYWEIAILQLALYILPPFIFSNMVSIGILSTEAGRRKPYVLFACGILLSIGYAALSAIQSIFTITSIGIWVFVLIIMVILFLIEIRYFFSKVEEGELLCTN